MTIGQVEQKLGKAQWTSRFGNEYTLHWVFRWTQPIDFHARYTEGDARVTELDLTLPQGWQVPPGVVPLKLPVANEPLVGALTKSLPTLTKVFADPGSSPDLASGIWDTRLPDSVGSLAFWAFEGPCDEIHMTFDFEGPMPPEDALPIVPARQGTEDAKNYWQPFGMPLTSTPQQVVDRYGGSADSIPVGVHAERVESVLAYPTPTSPLRVEFSFVRDDQGAPYLDMVAIIADGLEGAALKEQLRALRAKGLDDRCLGLLGLTKQQVMTRLGDPYGFDFDEFYYKFSRPDRYSGFLTVRFSTGPMPHVIGLVSSRGMLEEGGDPSAEAG